MFSGSGPRALRFRRQTADLVRFLRIKSTWIMAWPLTWFEVSYLAIIHEFKVLRSRWSQTSSNRLKYIFFAFNINQFFQYFLFSIQIPTKLREFEFSGLACQWSPYSSYYFTRNLQRWIKVRSFVIPVYVNLLHSGAFVAYSGVTLVSFLFVAVSFQLVPVYSGTILVHSVSFRRHSGLLRYIPVPFLSIPFHSAVFRYIPFRSCV